MQKQQNAPLKCGLIQLIFKNHVSQDFSVSVVKERFKDVGAVGL